MAKKINLSFLLLVSCAMSSLAFAHTTIKDQAIEGTTLYTADVIAHGCEHGIQPMLPVTAQSIVFPNGPNPIVTRSDDPNASINLADVLVGGEHAQGLLNPEAIQNNNVFQTIEPLTDETEVVRAIHYSDGKLPTDLLGIIPFKVNGLSFKEESCATKVQVHIGIADWCHHTGARRADIWIGRLTPVFNDAQVVSLGFWPTLVINRDLATNPLPESCGEGYEVVLEPSDQAIDQYLPMTGKPPQNPDKPPQNPADFGISTPHQLPIIQKLLSDKLINGFEARHL